MVTFRRRRIEIKKTRTEQEYVEKIEIKKTRMEQEYMDRIRSINTEYNDN